MNSTLKTIHERRAVRKYKDVPVIEEAVELLLDAARMAPSALNKQPWKFYILHTREQIQKFSHAIAHEAAKEIKHFKRGDVIKSLSTFHLSDIVDFFTGDTDLIFHHAPLVIFITAPKDDEWAALDVGMCAQNIMLAARSMGMDSCPVGLAKFVMNTEVYKTMNVPNADIVHLAIAIGFGNEQPSEPDRLRDNAFYIH